ncbi:SCP-like protein, partial [Opisthorchis viverrini]
LIIIVALIFAGHSQKGEILTPGKFKELHNKYRKMVRDGLVPSQPKAKELPDLVTCKNDRIYIRQILDDRLTNDATKWAKKCVFVSGTNLSDGENIAMAASLEVDPVTEWYKENESYKYGGITVDTFGKTGHYTQMVWADTKYLGCFQQLCDPLKFGKNGTLGKMYFSVCRYSP